MLLALGSPAAGPDVPDRPVGLVDENRQEPRADVGVELFPFGNSQLLVLRAVRRRSPGCHLGERDRPNVDVVHELVVGHIAVNGRDRDLGQQHGVFPDGVDVVLDDLLLGSPERHVLGAQFGRDGLEQLRGVLRFASSFPRTEDSSQPEASSRDVSELVSKDGFSLGNMTQALCHRAWCTLRTGSVFARWSF